MGSRLVNTRKYLELNAKINCIMLKAGRVFALLFSSEALTLLLEDTRQRKFSLGFKTRCANAGRCECPRYLSAIYTLFQSCIIFGGCLDKSSMGLFGFCFCLGLLVLKGK